MSIQPDSFWQHLDIQLQPHRFIGDKTPTLVVLQALLKSVKAHPAPDPERPLVKRLYHVPQRMAHALRLKPDKPLDLRITLVGPDPQMAEREWNGLLTYTEQEKQKAGFSVVGDPQISTVTIDSCLALPAQPVQHAELWFWSPLPFKREAGSPRTQLDLLGFMQQLQQRFKSLGLAMPAWPDLEGIELLHWYWNYTELHHVSKSQPGHTQYMNGCFGPLYFRTSGDLRPLLPWLRMAQALHAGGAVALNGMGYCDLYFPARPWLDTQLLQPKFWLPHIQRLQEEHPTWAENLAVTYGSSLEANGLAESMVKHISHPNWQPDPNTRFTVAKKDGERCLEQLSPWNQLLSSALLHHLQATLDRTLEPSAIGYRPGRSLQTATGQIKELLKAGYRYALESDIEDFFPSVKIAELLQMLDKKLAPADTLTRHLLTGLLHTPSLEHGTLRPRLHGLAQGSPLSPLLANLYLDQFDETLTDAGAKLIRYADDFVILTRTRAQAEHFLEQAQSVLQPLGLNLGMKKTLITDVAETGFHFLGQPFGGQANDTDPLLALDPVRKTVYIMEAGCALTQNGDALEIRRYGQITHTLPLRRVSDVVVLNHATISTGLMHRCGQHGIPITVTSPHGQHVVSLAPDSRRYHAVAQQQAWHHLQLSTTERLIMARGFAQQKIDNYKPLVRARYQSGHADWLSQLDRLRDAMEQADTVNSIRGYEGQAAKLVQRQLNEFIKVPAFHFQKRMRGKTDRMNSLFNFAYYLLFARLNTMLRASGLNPYLGYLHDGSDDNYETLVYDVMELFRAPVDRMLLAVVNLRIIQETDFHENELGFRLHPEAIKRLLVRFEGMLHEDLGGMNLLQGMQAQIHGLRRYVTGEGPMWFYQYTQKRTLPRGEATEKATEASPAADGNGDGDAF